MTQPEEGSQHWYAFKVFYNKVFEIDRDMRDQKVRTYFPKVRIYNSGEDKQKMSVKPAISSLIFVQCSEEKVWDLQKTFYGRVMLYTHKYEGTKKASPVDEDEMRVFMLVTSVEDDKLQYLDVESINYKEGQRVRVLDGPYKDCVGYIKRIKGNRRLLVAVEGLALVATSYIPSVFLEKIN
jgi:transcription antitermination factor NusG